MQIALVCNSAFGTDGISMFVLNNHRYFSHERMKYHLIYSSIHSPQIVVNGYIKDFMTDGDKVAFISKGNGLVKYAKGLFHYLKDEKIAILHVHGSSSAILIEMIVAKMAGVKRIVTHSHNTRGNHNVIHKILRPIVNWLADEKLACGDLAGKWMYGKHCKFTVIPNCIDTEKYKFDESIRKDIRKELGIDEDTILIGHVGMFTEIKNQKFLLHLLNKLKELSILEYKLLLIGHGPLKEQVEKEVEHLKLTNNVIFLGNRNNVHEIMMAMDVFCLPSLYEGFPIVSVEAQASGLPSLLSTNISPEVCITDLVKLLSIEHVDLWLQTLEKMNLKKEERGGYAHVIKSAGYDVHYSASMMECIYELYE